MKASANMHGVAKHTESCKLRAYPDPKTGGKPWTWGWGSTGPDIGPDKVGTQAEADARFIDDVVKREAVANNAITVPVTQGQFDAIVDMVFNVGTLVAFVSSIMTLEPGDILFTGTPAGVGILRNGDEVVVEIEGLGNLTNPVRKE